MGTRGHFLLVKQPGHEVDHSSPSSVKVKNVCVELSSTLPSVFVAWLLIRQRVHTQLPLLLWCHHVYTDQVPSERQSLTLIYSGFLILYQIFMLRQRRNIQYFFLLSNHKAGFWDICHHTCHKNCKNLFNI
jgi:hypothetical protein